ncbi:MAG: regulatory protein SipA [Leptolyngbyaceae cyanobacterium]
MTSSFKVGDRVRLATAPPYFKTADPMPMLRPGDLITVGAIGTLMDQRPGGYWGVRFETTTLLVDEAYLEAETS